MKICSKCKEKKLEIEFYKDKSNKDGLDFKCKSCAKLKYLKYKKQYPERLKERWQRINHSQKGRYYGYKGDAKRRGLCWEITFEQFQDLENNTCSYCDKYTKDKDYVGIDRLISKEGYKLSNCIPCCNTCNVMKLDYSLEEFLEHIKTISRYNN